MLPSWIKELDFELRSVAQEWGPWAAIPEVRMHPDTARHYLRELCTWSGTSRQPPARRLRGVFAWLGAWKLIADPDMPRGGAFIQLRGDTIATILTGS